MKIAILSDIHSNVFALEAVIADAKRHRVDLMVNLGDILYGPIAPKATYDLLMKHDFVTICGNQDRQIYEATATEISSNPTMEFIVKDLGNEPIDWMKSLPFGKQLTDEIYLCHGTPTDDLVYLLEDISAGYARLRLEKEIIHLLEGQQSKVICCGHTHVPRAVTLSTGQIIVNPGSVGLQAYSDDEPCNHSMENYHNHASYTIIEQSDSKWNIQQMKIPYDIQSAINECEKRNRKDWVHFIKTGRKQ